jgi:two-component sensor histidine kinase
LTRAETVQELKEAVIGRIQSLARAHALLANSRWEGVELSQLVAEEMAPFGGQASRVALSGEKLLLWPAAAQSLALVIHELATNAAKYGALSTLDGRIEIKWHVVSGEPRTLVMDWTERSSVTVAEPTSLGFGSRVIAASVERQLQGRVTPDWRPDGLHCRLEFPLRAAATTPEG